MATAVAIHAAYPNEFVVGPACSGFDWAWLTAAFAYGVLNESVFDAVSMHPYRSDNVETVINDYAQLRQLMAAYTPASRGQLPIISGEWGYTTCTQGTAACNYGNAVNEQTQAKYLARQWLTNTANGVAWSTWYDWKNDGVNASLPEQNFGSVSAIYNNATLPYAWKPSYVAANTLQTTLGNAVAAGGLLQSVSIVQDGSNATAADIFVVPFTMSGGGTSYAAWSNVTSCPAAGFRGDCGFYGIGQMECLARGCCFDEFDTSNRTQCFFPLPGPIVTWPTAAAACWTSVDFLGRSLGQVCTGAGAGSNVTLALSDSPIYLLSG